MGPKSPRGCSWDLKQSSPPLSPVKKTMVLSPRSSSFEASCPAQVKLRPCADRLPIGPPPPRLQSPRHHLRERRSTRARSLWPAGHWQPRLRWHHVIPHSRSSPACVRPAGRSIGPLLLRVPSNSTPPNALRRRREFLRNRNRLRVGSRRTHFDPPRDSDSFMSKQRCRVRSAFSR